jgi:choline-sulfatase
VRLALALALLLAGCHRSAGTYPHSDIFLVSIDTLRADRLSSYGYAKAHTPNLAALAAEGVVFEQQLSHYPLTLPAHASMLTGLLPQHHGVRSNSGFPLDPSHKTLATRLKQAGWVTGGAISSFVLARQSGIAEGFEFYEDAISGTAPEAFNAPQRDGAVTLNALTRWMAARGKQERLFGFLHLYEPHSPYNPPAQYKSMDPYDGEIAYADEIVGRLVAELKKSGRYEQSIIVVTGDHGESLGEHGEDEHGVFLYRSTLHVPLIVRLPGGIRGGSRVSSLVAQSDIAATILDLAGVARDGLDGRSLRPALDGKAMETRPVYSESLYPRYSFGWSELRALSDERFRYIRAPRPELYDVRTDPGETHSLDTGGATATAMRQSLAQMDSGGPPVPKRISAEQAEKLRALGYVAGGEASVKDDTSVLPDAKDRIVVYPKLKKALTAYRKHQWVEASSAFKDILQTDPRMVSVYGMLGESLLRQGKGEEAIEAFKQGLVQEPGRPGLSLAVAREYVREGRIDEALRYADAAGGDTPGAAAEIVSRLLMNQGKLSEAEHYARTAVAHNQNLLFAHFVLGTAEHKAGKYKEALASFQKALAVKGKGQVVPRLHANIGDCLARLGRPDEAEKEFLAEMEGNPAGPEAYLGLALLLRKKQGHEDEARRALEQWLIAVPHASSEHYWLLIRMFLFMNDTESARTWSKIAHEAFPSDTHFRGGEAPPGPASPAPSGAPGAPPQAP